MSEVSGGLPYLPHSAGVADLSLSPPLFGVASASLPLQLLLSHLSTRCLRILRNLRTNIGTAYFARGCTAPKLCNLSPKHANSVLSEVEWADSAEENPYCPICNNMRCPKMVQLPATFSFLKFQISNARPWFRFHSPRPANASGCSKMEDGPRSHGIIPPQIENQARGGLMSWLVRWLERKHPEILEEWKRRHPQLPSKNLETSPLQFSIG